MVKTSKKKREVKWLEKHQPKPAVFFLSVDPVANVSFYHPFSLLEMKNVDLQSHPDPEWASWAIGGTVVDPNWSLLWHKSIQLTFYKHAFQLRKIIAGISWNFHIVQFRKWYTYQKTYKYVSRSFEINVHSCFYFSLLIAMSQVADSWWNRWALSRPLISRKLPGFRSFAEKIGIPNLDIPINSWGWSLFWVCTAVVLGDTDSKTQKKLWFMFTS